MSDPVFQLQFELTDEERKHAVKRLRLLRLGDVGGLIGSSLLAAYALFVIGIGIATCFSRTQPPSDSIGQFAFGFPLLAIVTLINVLPLTLRSRPLVSLSEKIQVTVFPKYLHMDTISRQFSIPWTTITGVIPAGSTTLLITRTAFTAIPNRLLTPDHIACLRWYSYDSKHAPEKTFAFPVETTPPSQSNNLLK